MNPISAKLKIYTYSSIVLALTCAALRACCLFFAYDADLRYFSYSSSLPAIANGVLLCSLLWAASFLLLVPKNSMSTKPAAYSVSSVFASALCGFFFLYQSLSTAFPLLMKSFVPFSVATYRRDLTVAAIIAGSALISAVYFFTALFPALKEAPFRILCGFCPVIWAIVSLAQIYFDFTHTMNEPVKVSLQLAMISVAFFFLQEIRTLLGRPQPRAAWFAAIAALLFSGISGVAGIAAYMAQTAALKDYIDLFAVTASIFLYVLLRLFDLISNQPLSLEVASEEGETQA